MDRFQKRRWTFTFSERTLMLRRSKSNPAEKKPKALGNWAQGRHFFWTAEGRTEEVKKHQETIIKEAEQAVERKKTKKKDNEEKKARALLERSTKRNIGWTEADMPAMLPNSHGLLRWTQEDLTQDCSYITSLIKSAMDEQRKKTPAARKRKKNPSQGAPRKKRGRRAKVCHTSSHKHMSHVFRCTYEMACVMSKCVSKHLRRIICARPKQHRRDIHTAGRDGRRGIRGGTGRHGGRR